MGWFLIPKATPLEKAALGTRSSSHTRGGHLRSTLRHPFSQCSSLFTANPTFPSTTSFCLLCPTFYFLSPSFSVSLSNFWRPTRFTYSSHVSFGRCLALARPEAPREGPVSTVLTDTSQVPGDAQMHHNSQIQWTYLKQKFYNSVEDFYFPLGNYFFFRRKKLLLSLESPEHEFLNSLNAQTTELSKYSSQQKQDLLPDCNH